MDRNEIYIGIPAFNEESHIGSVIHELRKSGYQKIIIVDDGSEDNTMQVAQKAGAHCLRHPINCGAGAGVQTLISMARSEGWQYLVLMDADGQHLSKDIDNMFAKMKKTGSDIVIGDRFSQSLHNEVPRIKQFYNSLANVLTNWFCKGSYSDTQSGFRLLNRRAIEQLELDATGFGFCSEMIHKAEKEGLTIKEEPIHVIYTEYSRSKGQNNIWSGIRTAWQFIENI